MADISLTATEIAQIGDELAEQCRVAGYRADRAALTYAVLGTVRYLSTREDEQITRKQVVLLYATLGPKSRADAFKQWLAEHYPYTLDDDGAEAHLSKIRPRDFEAILAFADSKGF